ncbi:CD83 antigen isoform X2 [Clupea harengus]|uniref:CD83 antigen isoform X2 n=1 Tax=Clupea harengus TaxID=7950 RepID=A0A6P8G153_CLUHA|nr:CD83 antigen isoform X2 [Clupea harengus]
MSEQTIYILLTLAFASSSRIASEKSCTCGSVTELSCVALAEPGVPYRSIRWYKVDEENNLRGLVRKRLAPQNKTVEYYTGLIRHVEFVSENSSNIIMSNVTKMDSGRYICFLAAPLGHRNQEGEVFLRVDGCQVKELDYHSKELLELVVAIILILVSLLIFTISYVFLRNVLKSSRKKLIKEHLWKMSHPQGNMIYANGLKTLESVYV